VYVLYLHLPLQIPYLIFLDSGVWVLGSGSWVSVLCDIVI
jgi:hypothetical protein